MPRRPGLDREGEWYADGLQFECTQCGNCCTGPPGYVWLTDEESRDIATELDMDYGEFRKLYTRMIEGRLSLNEHHTEHGFDCIFLDRESQPGKAICGIYHSRPMQCRTWPFWPEMLKSKRSWESARRATPCPGMGNGKLIPIETIRIQRDLTPADT